MPQLEVEVAGLDELRRELQKVEDSVGVKVVRAAIRHGAKPAIQRAKALVPVSSPPRRFGHHLRDTIGVKIESKRNRKSAAQYRLGPQRRPATGQDPAGYRVAGGLSKSEKAPNYAAIINKDTRFLDRAIESTDDQVVTRIAEHLSKSIRKSVG